MSGLQLGLEKAPDESVCRILQYLCAGSDVCDLATEVNYSAELVMVNGANGDLVGQPGGCPVAVPNLDVAVLGDVTEAINKFSNLACAAKKTRVDIRPSELDFVIDFPNDVLAILAAFTGENYPEPVPADRCPFGRAP